MSITVDDLAAEGGAALPLEEATRQVLAPFAAAFTHVLGTTSCAAVLRGHVTGADLALPLATAMTATDRFADADLTLLEDAVSDLPVVELPGDDALRAEAYAPEQVVAAFCVHAADVLVDARLHTGGMAALTGVSGPAGQRVNAMADDWTGTVGELVHHVLTT